MMEWNKHKYRTRNFQSQLPKYVFILLKAKANWKSLWMVAKGGNKKWWKLVEKYDENNFFLNV